MKPNNPLSRRQFLLGSVALPAFAWQAAELRKHKITGVRLVNPRPAKPAPAYKPSADAWSVDKVEVANPMSIYPEYKATRSLFMRIRARCQASPSNSPPIPDSKATARAALVADPSC